MLVPAPAALFTSRCKFVPPLLAKLLYELLESRTDDACMYLSGTKLFAQDFASDDRLIAPQQLSKLVNNALRCADQELGFLLGQRLIQSSDPLAQLLNAQTNIIQALASLRCYQALWQVPIHYEGQVSDGQFHLNSWEILPQHDLNDFWRQVSAAALSGWCRHRQIDIYWQLPSHLQPQHRLWQRYLGLNITYGHPHLRATMALPSAKHQAPSPDLTMQQLNKQCQHSMSKLPLGHYILNAVYEQLAGNAHVSLEQVALHFGMSSSSLKRKLKDEGTNFSQLQDNYNRHQALHLAIDLNWSNAQMASYFEISDINNFRRAFKRWTGRNPSQLKQA
ncbi:helix-turn-helix transcriptional regulator [Neiella sp. HB171785]|uniref:Helix-turn-helix transcriptional regulator n=1 Tax=Neiella litorisoli TaxID=2771431 RepID=A0A8J6QHZ9_9GAMM|nr:AraC family transcriptional regulator [Neiella litorisoli]MBD1388868.1 helix-turn-helix transcriptional regulator [Neiella litorisoli]